jgi:hypothetical protein
MINRNFRLLYACSLTKYQQYTYFTANKTKGKKMRTLLFNLVIIASVTCSAFAADNCMADQGIALTVYNGNFAVVRDTRQMLFSAGTNTIKFSDVASQIDPTSVNFKCLSAPDAVTILEQNYEYDLVNADKLLEKYLDKKIVLALKGSGADTGKQMTGLLLSSRGGDYIIRTAQGLRIIKKNAVEDIALAQASDDLLTKPTLVWLANAKTDAQQLCRVTYTTSGIKWNADYSVILNENDTALDLTGWVTINNQSGGAYKDAAIKLIAGDVQRIQQQPRFRGKGMMMAMDSMEAAPAFVEKSFMEYHLYTLQRKSTINDNQVKQIEFITPAQNVPAKKLFIYERQKRADKVQVKIEFENKKDFGLGIALPAGKIRVFKQNADDNMLEFVGEDMIDHTPTKEKLKIYIGNAFDIVPEYKLLNSQVARRQRTDSHQIEFRNRKQEAIEILVDEKFGKNVNWTIDKSSHQYEKTDATTARFKIKIPADSVQTVTYTATQTW